MTESACNGLTAYGTGGGGLTGCGFISLVSCSAGKGYLENVSASGVRADSYCPRAFFTGGLTCDYIAVSVLKTLSDVIKSLLMTFGALVKSVTKLIAGCSLLGRGLFVSVVSSLTLHSLSFLECYCIEGEVLNKEGNLFGFSIVNYLGDSFNASVFCKIVDNDTVSVVIAVIVGESNGNLRCEGIGVSCAVLLNGKVVYGSVLKSFLSCGVGNLFYRRVLCSVVKSAGRYIER